MTAASTFDASCRKVDYLRISVTDRCNERCLYCMPEGFTDWLPKAEILRYEEILTVVQAVTKMGFRKFRITGGEPLVRKSLTEFIARMAKIPGVDAIGMTTNATRLAGAADGLARAGMESLNISLDALTSEVYRKITGWDVSAALEGIEAALAAGFKRVKLNTVLIRGMNEEEIWPLAEFAAARGLVLRFIELMPVSVSEMLSEENFLPVGEVMRSLAARDSLTPLEAARLGHGPARYYRLERANVTVGFIGSRSASELAQRLSSPTRGAGVRKWVLHFQRARRRPHAGRLHSFANKACQSLSGLSWAEPRLEGPRP